MKLFPWAAGAMIAAVLVAWIAPSSGKASMIDIGVDATFTETGPGLLFDSAGVGDTLTITNTSQPGARITAIDITLGAQLSFDVGGGFFSSGGFGAPPAIVDDGGTGVAFTPTGLSFTNFDAGKTVVVSIDVDGLILQVISGNIFAFGTTISTTFAGTDFANGSETLAGGFIGRGALDPNADASLIGKAMLVPEPASLALLGVGLTIALYRTRKREHHDGE